MCQTSAACLQCKHVKDGPYCQSECPLRKYPDDNGVCQYCHENCVEHGCTGPLNGVGYGACNACDIAVYDRENSVTVCLEPDSDCDVGYYKHTPLPAEYGPMTGKQVGLIHSTLQLGFESNEVSMIRRVCGCTLKEKKSGRSHLALGGIVVNVWGWEGEVILGRQWYRWIGGCRVPIGYL